MAGGGLPTPRADHTAAVADMALDRMRAVEKFNARRRTQYRLRLGMHTGPVIAGIIGQNKFAYALWGSTVNLASRMESQGQVGAIQTTAAINERLKEQLRFQPRGSLEVKGFGEMSTCFLQGCA